MSRTAPPKGRVPATPASAAASALDPAAPTQTRARPTQSQEKSSRRRWSEANVVGRHAPVRKPEDRRQKRDSQYPGRVEHVLVKETLGRATEKKYFRGVFRRPSRLRPPDLSGAVH